MQISRRDALMGATAAAAVTGLSVAPLAMKAVAVKAALGGVPGAVQGDDTHLEALYRTWREAYAEHIAAHDWSGGLLSGDPAWHVADRAVTRTGYRQSACLDKLLEASAHTLPGVLIKVGAIVEHAEDGADPDHYDALEVIKADLERLAGEARP